MPIVKKSRYAVLVFMLWCGLGCPQGAVPLPPLSATIISGRALLNANGEVRIYRAGTHELVDTVKTDEAGRFSATMGVAQGDFVLEAWGGSYTEPASATPTHVDGSRLRAAVFDVGVAETPFVVISPWTEFAAASSNYKNVAQALTTLLSCNNGAFANLLRTDPAMPAKGGPAQSVSPAVLAYIYQGAWSQLATELSAEAQVQSGARITSMALASVVAQDLEDGRLDGTKHGAKLELANGFFLPPDLLRQRLAQATRHFLESQANETSVRTHAVMDLLQCVSASADLRLGPAGEPFDVDGPTIKILTPLEGSYLSSSQDVVCGATDVSGLASVTASLWRGAQELTQALGASTTQDSGPTRQPLHLENVASGPLTVRCEATDRWGNATATQHEFYVNRGGHSPSISLGASNQESLAGVVEITCACDDDPYSQRCELEPLAAGATPELISQAEGKSVYAWDTRQILDGTHVLTCMNWSQGIARPSVHSLITHVRNHEDGVADGTVFLDTAVQYVTVTARVYENGTSGRVLGSGEAADGTFKFPIGTDYRGPLLFEAVASQKATEQASFHNVPLDSSMAFSNGRLTLLIAHYEPGESLSGLSVNVASSMAESLTAAMWERRGKDSPRFTDVHETAHRLVGQYLQPTRPFDYRFTRVADLRTAESLADDDQRVLGLFHVGLSRLAVEYSGRSCLGTTCITVIDILGGMRRDLSDAKLDGHDKWGPPVHLGYSVFLNQDFFRIELARAIRHFLDATPVAGLKYKPTNKCGLDASSDAAAMLQNFAAHDSALFGHRPGARYDEDGPRLDVTLLNTDGEILDLKAPLSRARFRVVVDAEDDSKIAWIRASVDGTPLTNVHSSKADHGEYWIDTNSLRNGDLQITVEAQDGAGNQSVPHFIYFTVDKIPPVVTLDKQEIWINRGDAHQVVMAVSKPYATAQIFEGQQPLTDAWEITDTGFLAQAAPVTCGAHHTLTIRVVDEAGNRVESTQLVHCDAVAPQMGQLPSPYAQEKSGATIELQFRVQGDPQNVQLQPKEETVVLEKQWGRLDLNEDRNLPRLRFSVTDADVHGIGTPHEALHVTYKYIFRSSGGSQERDWMPVDCSQGTCEVVMSYQTLLPTGVVTQPVTAARLQNFIAHSSTDDLHTVLVKIEDQAGNVTLAEWTTRLRLFSPPVTVDCGVQPDLTQKTLSPSTIPSYAEAGVSPFYVNLGWGVDRAVDSLTPDNGGYVFDFDDSQAVWIIEKIAAQIVKLREYETRTGARRPCWDLDHPWFLRFEDGDCHRLDRRNTYPRHWDDSNTNFAQYHANQGLAPMHRRILLHPNGAEHNPLSTIEKPRRHSDGQPLPVVGGQNTFGHPLTQFSYRRGIEHERAVNPMQNSRGTALDVEERGFIKAMSLVRDPYLPRLVTILPGTPPPMEIAYGENCKHRLVARWGINNGPVISLE